MNEKKTWTKKTFCKKFATGFTLKFHFLYPGILYRIETSSLDKACSMDLQEAKSYGDRLKKIRSTKPDELRMLEDFSLRMEGYFLEQLK